MKRIVSKDTIILNHSAEKVFYAVADVTVYKDWWSRKVSVNVLESKESFTGSKVEVSASGGRFRCEIVSAVKHSEVRVKYYDGVQTGEGIWTIEEISDSKTRLTYSINLEPNGFIPRLLSNFMNFSGMHSKSMKEMFEGLERYLDSD